MYQARTIWQGEPQWELIITLGQFEDIKSAAYFANRGIQKLYYDEELRSLFVISKKGETIQVQQEQLVVSKIKPEAVGKLMVDAGDFEPVDVKIEDFPEIEGLDSGFGSLAYSVVDEAGNFVDYRQYAEEMMAIHETEMSQVKSKPIYSEQQLRKLLEDLEQCLQEREGRG